MTLRLLGSSRHFFHAALTLVLFAAVASAAQTAPKIKRIDPPNWWAGFEPDVMLLLT